MEEKKQELQQEESCCCCQKKKHRETEEYRNLLNRLSRIEGQVRGVRNMVEEERYCVDILNQVSAIQSALNSFNKELLSSHIKTCVVEDIRRGDEQVVDELCEAIKKLMR
ncbi:MAG: metal-sensing transcriptional repressor [Lachnospiraceae bacterium]|nr:metal-sensing transcriptional repressor [Lachnospiraceae bacterium]